MAVLNSTDVITQLNWRYAVKKFDSNRQIAAHDWNALEQALVLSPSSFGLQPWKFIVVNNTSLREKLLAASWNQKQVIDASHLVVFTVRPTLGVEDVDRFLASTAATRNVAIESLKGYRDMMLGFISQPGFDLRAWADRQAYIALGTFMTAAAVMGIDTCPMEGIVPAKYDELLGLADSDYRTSVVAVAGYRAADDKYASLPKVRYATREVVEQR
jgi:nitroreductase